MWQALQRLCSYVKETATNTVATVREGANELYNPKKRRRSTSSLSIPLQSQSQSQLQLQPQLQSHSLSNSFSFSNSHSQSPARSLSRASSSPSIFPRSSFYARQQHQQNQQNQQNQQPLQYQHQHQVLNTDDAPPQQQPLKRRRISSLSSSSPSTFENNHQNPFLPIRRESSHLADALQAPTPPSLSFASSRLHTQNQRTSAFRSSTINPNTTKDAVATQYAYQRYPFHASFTQHKNQQQQPQQKRQFYGKSFNGFYATPVNNAIRSNSFKKRSLSPSQKQRQQQNQKSHLSNESVLIKSRKPPLPTNMNKGSSNIKTAVTGKTKGEKPKIPSKVANLPHPSGTGLSSMQQPYRYQSYQQLPLQNIKQPLTATVPTSFLQLAQRGLQIQDEGLKNEETKLYIDRVKREKEEKLRDEKRKEIEETLAKKVSRSKIRSSDLALELYVKQQQLYQDQMRRERAQQALHESIQIDDDDDDEINVEQPPANASYWNDVYWRTDGYSMRWNEQMDQNAIQERKHKTTTVENEHSQGSIESSAFAPLTQCAKKRLQCTFSNEQNQYMELAKFNGCVITGEDLRKLKPNCWLNDEIVNAYTSLIAARNEETRSKIESMNSNGHSNNTSEHMNGNGNGHHSTLNNNKMTSTVAPPKIKMMNSFFYAKLVEVDRFTKAEKYNYQRVRRWTRRFDVFAYDQMIIPINQQNLHWTLGLIDFRKRTVMHLDSMGTGGSPNVQEHLLRWVHDEAKERNKMQHVQGDHEWKAVPCSVPIQENTDDCGVFLCKFADFLCRGWSTFTFSQQHMLYFRSRIAHELLMEKAR